MYLKGLRDVLCEIQIWVTGELCYSLEYNVDALNIKWKVYLLSKETRMKGKRKAFVKVC